MKTIESLHEVLLVSLTQILLRGSMERCDLPDKSVLSHSPVLMCEANRQFAEILVRRLGFSDGAIGGSRLHPDGGEPQVFAEQGGELHYRG
jgi:hypothetical protein